MKSSILMALILSLMPVLSMADDRDDRLRRREDRNDGEVRPGAPAPRPPAPQPPPSRPNERDEGRRVRPDDRRPPALPPGRPDHVPPHMRPQPPRYGGPARTPDEWRRHRVDRWGQREYDRDWLRRRSDWRARYWESNRILYRDYAYRWWSSYGYPNAFMIGTSLLSDNVYDYQHVEAFGAGRSVSYVRLVALRDGAYLDTLSLRYCGGGGMTYRLNTNLFENQSTNWIDVRTSRISRWTIVKDPVCIDSYTLSGYGDRTGFDEYWESDETQIVLVGSP